MKQVGSEYEDVVNVGASSVQVNTLVIFIICHYISYNYVYIKHAKYECTRKLMSIWYCLGAALIAACAAR
jgi:hypothetical protein